VLALALTLSLLSAAAPPPGPCPPRWERLPERACLLRGGRPGLVVYLHGLAPNAFAVSAEWQALGEVASAQRPAVVALWGVEGLCPWAPQALCWPSDRSQLAEVGALERRLAAVLSAAWARLGHRALPVIAGYSNGAYCAAILIGDSLVPAAGWALLQGGPVTGTAFPVSRARPTWLLAAAGDPIQGPAMKSLEGLLREAGWKPTLVVRPGEHPAEVDDFRRLFAFAATVTRG
jgi:predicted esterase